MILITKTSINGINDQTRQRGVCVCVCVCLCRLLMFEIVADRGVPSRHSNPLAVLLSIVFCLPPYPQFSKVLYLQSRVTPQFTTIAAGGESAPVRNCSRCVCFKVRTLQNWSAVDRFRSFRSRHTISSKAAISVELS